MSSPAEPAHRPVPSWATIWQAVQVGLYTAVCAFLAGAIADGIGVNVNGTALAAVNAGLAAVLAFLGWTAAGTLNARHPPAHATTTQERGDDDAVSDPPSG
jgi:hypothetical protein